MAHRRRSRGSRPRGFTLIELVITVAIFSTIAGLAAWGGKGVLPMWQTRTMANKLKSDLESCRAIAIQTGNYCRVQFASYETSLTWPTRVNKGTWLVQVCNLQGGTAYDNGTCWDTLPIDVADSLSPTSLRAEGSVEMEDKTDAHYAKWTSINGFGGADNDVSPPLLDWTTPNTNDDAIVFDARGRVVNPSTHFGESAANNRLYVNIVDKFRYLEEGVLDCYTVGIGRLDVASGVVTVQRTSGNACPNHL